VPSYCTNSASTSILSPSDLERVTFLSSNRDDSDMSVEPSPELRSLFETARNEYEKQAGSNLVEHQLTVRLRGCDSADSVLAVLQEQAEAFHKFRGHDGKVIKWLKRTVHVLHTLSTSGVLGEGIGLVRL
jgi:hypothetical protein